LQAAVLLPELMAESAALGLALRLLPFWIGATVIWRPCACWAAPKQQDDMEGSGLLFP
jgi:hypothetical protein